MGEITIVGLGPGDYGLITVETLEVLKAADTLLLRTVKHPTAAYLSRIGLQFASYDFVYEEKGTFEGVYEAIVCDCLDRARTEKVVYAVPGSPLVAEKTVTMIRQKAKERNIPVKILPGMSFLEVLYTRLEVDPIQGVTVVDAADIAALPLGLRTALVVTQVYNRQVASDAKLALMEQYPDEHPITVMKNLGLADEKVRVVPLYELDRMEEIDHLTSVYVPPLGKRCSTFIMQPLVDVMCKLRSPDGCIWDLEQTHKSLRRYLVEEVYEVLEAIDLEDEEKLCEELGDLLLQIVFHARLAEEVGAFSMQDVITAVTEKMIRRHPHVFGDISVQSAAEVVMNWDKIKKTEKGHERKYVLDGIPSGLPSLMRAYKLQVKAAKVGFDWDTIAPVWGKIKEELVELQEAVELRDLNHMEEELGDVLFAIVNLARFLEIDGEVALQRTNHKFIRRFQYIENEIIEKGRKWNDMTLMDLDELWSQAKKDGL
jgi:tetrapyrrole methylase family protein/MazG family protein